MKRALLRAFLLKSGNPTIKPFLRVENYLFYGGIVFTLTSRYYFAIDHPFLEKRRKFSPFSTLFE